MDGTNLDPQPMCARRRTCAYNGGKLAKAPPPPPDDPKDMGGHQEEVLSIEKFGGYKIQVKEIIEEKKRQALRSKVKEEKNLRDIRGIEGR